MQTAVAKIWTRKAGGRYVEGTEGLWPRRSGGEQLLSFVPESMKKMIPSHFDVPVSSAMHVATFAPPVSPARLQYSDESRHAFFQLADSLLCDLHLRRLCVDGDESVRVSASMTKRNLWACPGGWIFPFAVLSSSWVYASFRLCCSDLWLSMFYSLENRFLCCTIAFELIGANQAWWKS